MRASSGSAGHLMTLKHSLEVATKTHRWKRSTSSPQGDPWQASWLSAEFRPVTHPISNNDFNPSQIRKSNVTTNILHPALAQLLRHQASARLGRICRGFSTPRRLVLSCLGLLLALIWLSNAALTVFLRQPSDPAARRNTTHHSNPSTRAICCLP